MEYYSNINHRVFNEWTILAESQHGQKYTFDIIDQVIIETIRKYQNPALSPGLHRNENNYVWLKHSYFIEQLPFLKIKEAALKKRLKKLYDIGILLRNHEYTNKNNQVSKRVFYKVNPVYDEIKQIINKLDKIEKTVCDQEEKEKQKRKIKYPSIPRMGNKSLTKNNEKRDKKGRFLKVEISCKGNTSLTDSVSQSLTSREINPLHQGNEIPLDSYTTDNDIINKKTRDNKTIFTEKRNLLSSKDIPKEINDEQKIKQREENKKKFDLSLLNIESWIPGKDDLF